MWQRAGGGPAGSARSPLLRTSCSMIFDQEFGVRGHRLVIYAVTSGLREVKRAAERVLEQSTGCCSSGWLKVNVAVGDRPAANSCVAGVRHFYYLVRSQAGSRRRRGCGQGPNPGAHVPAVECVKDGLPGAGGSATSTCGAGWDLPVGARPEVLRPGRMVRRRLRQIRWKEWKRPRTRWRICVPSGFGLIWPGSGACPVVVTGVLLKSPDSAPGVADQLWQERGVVFFHPAWARFRTT